MRKNVFLLNCTKCRTKAAAFVRHFSILIHILSNAVLSISNSISAQEWLTGNVTFLDILIHRDETDFFVYSHHSCHCHAYAKARMRGRERNPVSYLNEIKYRTEAFYLRLNS